MSTSSPTHRTTSRRSHTVRASKGSAGFTLPEVLVAIAALLVLAVAIGRLFSSVGTLVNTGTATTELDTLARSIEDRIRSDIERMNALPEDMVFLAIRGNRVGDVDLNGTIDPTPAGDPPNETLLYLTQEDREADERSGTTGRSIQSTRIDEIVFVAKGPWESTQQSTGQPAFTADAAMISYGHGLYADLIQPTNANLESGIDPSNTNTFPQRTVTPDGLRNDGDPWITAYGARFTSNEYVARWPLTRQAVLLAGGAAVATEGTTSGAPPVSLVGATRTVAPTVRDLENEWFMFQNLTSTRVLDTPLDNAMYTRLDIANDINQGARVQQASGTTNADELALPRFGLLRWGRTDIAAQSLGDLRRWFEGQSNPWLANETNDWPVNNYNPTYADATAFSAGYFDVPEPAYMAYNEPDDGGTSGISIDSPLWIRAGLGDDSEFGFLGGTGTNAANESGVRQVNEMALQNAITGVFARRLVSDGAQPLRRVVGENAELNPQDEALDLAHIISSRCSRFEVAWSNGLTVPDDVREIIVTMGSIETRFASGELIWFDQNFPYGVFQLGEITTTQASGFNGGSNSSNGIPQVQYIAAPGATGQADDFVQAFAQDSNPEARSTWRLRDTASPTSGPSYHTTSIRDNWDNNAFGIDSNVNNISTNTLGGNAQAFGFAVNDGAAVASTDVYGGYDPFTSGGATLQNQDTEYLAIWGFRRAAGDGEWGDTWIKPRFLRFRMTLHDTEFRLDAGRDYEFIVELKPQPPLVAQGN